MVTSIGFWGSNNYRNEPYGLKCYFEDDFFFFLPEIIWLARQLEISPLALICFYIFCQNSKGKTHHAHF